MRRDHQRAIKALKDHQRRLNRSPRTWSVLGSVVRRFLATLSDRPLKSAGRADVEAFLASHERANHSAWTQANQLGRLRCFFRAMLGAGLVDSDPTEGLKVKSGQTSPRVLLSMQDVQALFAAASRQASPHLALRDRAVLELLYATGMRSLEATRVRVLDLDLQRGEVLVRPAKNGPPRRLPLPPRCLPQVKRYLEEGRAGLVRGKESGLLFLTRRGDPLKPSTLRTLVRRTGAGAGQPEVHPHAFRRALATHLAQAGVDLRTVQIVLGHANLNTTAAYVAADAEELREAVESLNLARTTAQFEGLSVV